MMDKNVVVDHKVMLCGLILNLRLQSGLENAE